MRRMSIFRGLVVLAPCVLNAIHGQFAVSPQFEVASVKPGIVDSRSASGIKTGHGKLEGYNVTLRRCITGAYGVGPHQIIGAPDWAKSDRFQILAKADSPVDDDAVLMVMLQGLLADRFKLALHRETRILPALVLEVAKNGPKLQKADTAEAVTNTSSTSTGVTINASGADLNSFVQILSRQVDQPVVNRTGLTGIFNFKLSWMPEKAKLVDPSTDEPSIFTAIREQLGLRLRSEKAPVEVLVIDHVEKPSAN